MKPTDKRWVSREQWERTARRELRNILDFIGVINVLGLSRRQVELCERIRELLATETE